MSRYFAATSNFQPDAASPDVFTSSFRALADLEQSQDDTRDASPHLFVPFKGRYFCRSKCKHTVLHEFCV